MDRLSRIGGLTRKLSDLVRQQELLDEQREVLVKKQVKAVQELDTLLHQTVDEPERRCISCGTDISALRAGAMACSAKCRMAAFRAKEKA